MARNNPPTLLLIGNDARLNYLLQRYAAQSGYSTLTHPAILPFGETGTIEPAPALIIFLAPELLETAEEFLAHGIPIAVCASATDEPRVRDLGADYCLLHPVLYEDFQRALEALIGPAAPNQVESP